MRVHSHTSLPSQLAILRCYSYLSVLYFPLILLSVRRVPSRVDVLPFSLSAFCCCFSPCVRHSSVLVPFPVCATQGQHLLLSFSACMRACSRIYLCTSTLSFVIVLSPPFSSRSLCALRKPHTLDTRCRCLRLSFTVESYRGLSYSGFGSISRHPSVLRPPSAWATCSSNSCIPMRRRSRRRAIPFPLRQAQ
jgi:hypothetical protein